jgi:hypothetical protein
MTDKREEEKIRVKYSSAEDYLFNICRFVGSVVHKSGKNHTKVAR